MIKETELKNQISSNQISSLYLFIGDESYLKRQYVRKIVSSVLTDGMEEFNYTRFEGKDIDLNDVFDLALQFPMMSDRRCILVDDYKFDSIGEDDLALIEQSFSSLPESTVLIFLQDISVINKRGAGKRLIDLFEKYGNVVSFDKRQGDALIRPLISSAKKSGCELDKATAQYFVEQVGDDYNTLLNELNKVCSFVGSGVITTKHIDEVATTTPQTKIFLLTDYLLSGNIDKAFEVYDILVFQKTEPELMLGVIVSAFVDLYRIKCALEQGLTLSEIVIKLDAKNKEYGFRKHIQRQRRIDLDKLRSCLDLLEEADMKLKRARDNPNIIIEQLIVKLYISLNERTGSRI